MQLNLRSIRYALGAFGLFAAVACSSAVEASRSDGPSTGEVEIVVANENDEPYALTVIDLDGRALISTTTGVLAYGVSGETTDDLICNESCTDSWVPIAPEIGGASLRLDATEYGVFERPDGTEQVTYRGIPLYTSVFASEPGSLAGVGIAGTWFALQADGTKVRTIEP